MPFGTHSAHTRAKNTPQHLLQRYYRQGHQAGLTDKTVLPYALPRHNAISDAEWQHKVGWFSYPRYLHDMEAIYAERAVLRFDAFYRTMDLANPIQAFHAEAEQAEQAKQANAPDEHTTASADSQSVYRQAKAAAIGSNRC